MKTIKVPFAMNILQAACPFFTEILVLTEDFFRMSPYLTDEYKTPFEQKAFKITGRQDSLL